MLGQFRTKPKSKWPWIFWWRADQEDLEDQATNYDRLGWLDSFRKLSVLGLLFSAAITVFTALFTRAYSTLFDVALFAGLAAFIYRGHRWATIAAMALWTFEKIVGTATQFATNPAVAASIPVALLWWALYMHAFYMAFLVEQKRRKPAGVQSLDQAKAS